jgi:S1-C subfamily serine protease
LVFQEAGSKSQDQKKHGEKLKVTLGIMPDFAGIEDKGLRADMVIKGKPADRAGMKNGDIITAINGHSVGDIYDYMERLSKLKPGQNITIEIIRNGTKQVLMVQL